MENKNNIEISTVLKVLAYYDVFNYPLTSHEICSFTKSISKNEVDDELNKYVASSIVYKIEEFYSLQNDSSLVETRKKGNNLAEGFTPKAVTTTFSKSTPSNRVTFKVVPVISISCAAYPI